ncbi:uncharacterized protein [Arachis hypogaea]|uniref:uncharacterized protein n=1 Tax=Arachis hypogaea TaxID=3818 RepID=UPI003B224E85
MIVNSTFDKVLCRYFPSYLDGPALDWFCSLPAGSISRFRDISKPFEEHFAGSAIYLHDSDYLNTVKQGQDESLKDYITRFTKIAISATYQRLMDKIFAKQIGRNIEVYVDNMVAKTKIGKNHLDDLTEIFGQLRKYNMRLNPEKCAFGVQSGKFLGFMLTSRDKHLRQVLQKPELAGRLVKWSVELSEFDIKYEGRASIKSQFLADFIAEFSVPSTTEDYIEWSLYVDGSSNPQECGAGIILDDGHGNIIEHSLNFSFKARNNQSEYEALIAGLRLAADLNITELKEAYWRSPYIQYLQTGIFPATSKMLDTSADKPPFLQFIIIAYIDGDSLVHCLNVFAEKKPSLHLLRHMKGSVEHTSEPEVYNGCQFADRKFTSFLQNLKIKQHFSSVEHPQTNGLAEATNKVILHALRKKLDDAKGLWAELIPDIIWGYNTTIHSTTKETPFRLVYGSDAMIPVEISQSSLCTELANQTTQDIARQSELDLIEELRSSTTVKHLAMQQHIV